jgi:uncharacterized cupin superfamily protein
VALLGICGGSLASESMSAATPASAPTGETMIVYSPHQKVDESLLVPLRTSPETLGGQVLAGSPEISVRIDQAEAGMTAGIFKMTTGRVKVLFPFTEHATILEGEVTITDESGQSRSFKKGDSYFIRQGQTVIAEVTSPHMIKSFFNVMK